MSETTELPIEAEPPRRANRGRLVALGVGVIAVVGAGVFVAVAMSDNGNSPEDPVKAMLASAQQGDVLGVLAQLDPGERDALRQPLTDLTAELNRLDVLHGASLSHISGIDLKIKDLAFKATPVRDGLAQVKITSGSSTYNVDASKLPLGDFVRGLAGNSLKHASSSGTGDLRSTKSSDFAVTVKRGSRWYLSAGYTVAEQARQSAHVSLADMGSGVPARGAATPEAAVRDLITAATKLDVRRMIELLPPDEMGAVHDYAGLFVDEATKVTGQASRLFQITVPTLDLKADTSGSHSLVTVTKMAIEGRAGGFAASYRDGCFDLTPPAGAQTPIPKIHFCANANPGEIFKSLGLSSKLTPPRLSFTGKHAKVGFVVTQVDGKWYVSPTRTVLEDFVASVKLFQPGDLTTLRDYITQFMGEFAKMTSGSFSGTATATRPY